MLPSVRPLTSRLARKLFKRDFTHFARETVEVAPANLRYRAPAISLPGEIDRATGFGGNRPADIRMNLAEGEYLHPATVIRRYADVIVADGCVYDRRAVAVIAPGARTPLLAGPFVALGEAQLTSSINGTRFFGDWLMLDIPLELLACELGFRPLSLAPRTWTHEPGYRTRMNVPAPPPIAPRTRVRSLWIADDNGMTVNRIARYERMRAGARQPQAAAAPRRVFIDRGATAVGRQLTNRDAVVDALVARGYRPITPETMAVEEIAAALSHARVCVGIEGSAMTHAAIMLPERATMVALMPPSFCTDILKWYADAVGLRFGFVVGEEAGDAAAHDFSIDPARLAATLDLVDEG